MRFNQIYLKVNNYKMSSKIKDFFYNIVHFKTVITFIFLFSYFIKILFVVVGKTYTLQSSLRVTVFEIFEYKIFDLMN